MFDVLRELGRGSSLPFRDITAMFSLFHVCNWINS